MIRKLIGRMSCGFSASVIVTIIVQLCTSGAGRSPVTPEFSAHFENEISAVLIQLLLTGCIGMAFAGASLAFENERWSYLLQGALHFGITAAVWIPITILCWRPISPLALYCSIAGWIFTYAATWLIQYLLARRDVRELNRRIRDGGREDERN